MKERDHFLSKNMVNAPECGKLHLHLSKFSGGEVPDPPPKCPPHSQNAADALAVSTQLQGQENYSIYFP